MPPLPPIRASQSARSSPASRPTWPQPPILPPEDGFLFLDREKFAASFAGDVAPELAAFMADAQVPWGVGGPNGIVSEAAWRRKPSWYLVATDDRMIPPQAQRTMAERIGATVTETPGSHAVYVSNPRGRRRPDQAGGTVGPSRNDSRRLTSQVTTTPVGRARSPRFLPTLLTLLFHRPRMVSSEARE
jgi:hypothetical protein